MKVKVPLQIVELEPGNYHLVVIGKFEDGTAVNWVVDTGASKSVFDKNLPERFTIIEDETEEIHSAGIGEAPLETSLGKLEPFYLGKLKIDHLKMAILDLAHINDLYAKAINLNIGGLIGGDFLMNHQAIIDYKKRILILKSTG